jgi:hypothetical protein
MPHTGRNNFRSGLLSCHRYVTSLPQVPPTASTLSPAWRQVSFGRCLHLSRRGARASPPADDGVRYTKQARSDFSVDMVAAAYPEITSMPGGCCVLKHGGARKRRAANKGATQCALLRCLKATTTPTSCVSLKSGIGTRLSAGKIALLPCTGEGGMYLHANGQFAKLP